MTEPAATAVPETTQVSPARLEPDAIGVAQDTVIGMANAAPSVSVGLTLAGLAAATAYASGPIILLTAVPMLIVANAYRRLNLWNANCGASFEWVGRAMNPYLGFITGWLMIAGSLVGAISGVVVLAPSVLAVFGASATSTWPNIIISTAVILVMLVIAVAGIRITARTQVSLGLIEYVILVGFAIAGLVAVLGHHHGTFPITRGWFSVTGIGGHGSLAAGFLIAVFMYTGWDASVYVNEEVTHRRANPGRAAVMAVAFLAIIFIVSEVGLQGVVSPARLQANSASALVYVGQALGGSGWAKVIALSLALSVIASTGTALVIIARMAYGMARQRVLPLFLGNVSYRFSTPATASIVVGVVLIVATWIYLLSSSIANVFTQLIDVTGLLYAAFYVLTAIAAIVYYRRRIVSNPWDAVLVGILPVGAVAFLVWMVVKSLQAAPASQIWSLAGIVGVGFILMIVARFVLRSPFFGIPRESASRDR
ncbi:MAG: APC family permease [Streptosporangiaceae bacterium]